MSPRQTAGTLSACHRAPSVPRATCQLRDRGSREEESKFVPWQRWGWVCVLQPALSSSLSFLSSLFRCRSYKDGEITAAVLGEFKLKTCRGIKHRGDFVSIGSVRNCWGGVESSRYFSAHKEIIFPIETVLNRRKRPFTNKMFPYIVWKSSPPHERRGPPIPSDAASRQPARSQPATSSALS